MKYVTHDNFMIFAAHYYDNPTCATEADFKCDLDRIKFILKMFKRYEKDGVINERLVLNHLILLYNVFEHDAATKMLVLKLDKYLHLLKPFLILLSYWPSEKIVDVGGENIIIMSSNVPMDAVLVDRLRKI